MKLRPTEATEYLKNNQPCLREEFVVDVTVQEFDELYSSVKELRGRTKWIEAFSSDADLNDFLREVVRADLQIRFIETFPPIDETEREIYLVSRRGAQDASPRPPANGNRKTRLRPAQNKLETSKVCTPEEPENLLSIP